ncbi:hypothetical protein PCASD_12124 [Puccinia coronata f. sp. avenae]|uniref:Uncharacterized protein n=1 Tax=Puccinia coronata f. sp. avenae TaxID=200324 RepID=A0A2N5UDR0_9BASI|nr:hypothetical protein PCASD_12124 [Puccinia coronata f. sp. avenae]
MRWGSAPSSATWAYERLNGKFSSFGRNNSVDKIPLTILQHMCRIANLNFLVKSPSAPPEVKQLYQILDKDQSNINHSSSKPLQETGE